MVRAARLVKLFVFLMSGVSSLQESDKLDSNVQDLRAQSQRFCAQRTEMAERISEVESQVEAFSEVILFQSKALVHRGPGAPEPWKQIRFYVGDADELGNKGELHSQCGQDYLVAALLGCKREGFFVDLAANDAKVLSNTLMLERDFGWNGICIEPNTEYMYGLARRKCSVVVAAAGQSGKTVPFTMKGVFGGIVGDAFDNKVNSSEEHIVQLRTVALGSLLDTMQAPKSIDYLSLDVEGAESLIMENFPWDEYSFKVLTVERPHQDLQDWMTKAGYYLLRINGPFNDQTWIYKAAFPDFERLAEAWADGVTPVSSCMDELSYAKPDYDSMQHAC